MARNYYSGVPIGGTIFWAGGIIGLSIPDNFVENYQLSSYTDERKSDNIIATSLPSAEGYYLRGYNRTDFSTVQQYDANNTVTLTLDNMPVVSLSLDNDGFPTFSWSASDVEGMFSIGSNTTSSSFGTVTSSTARETSTTTDYPTRYAPYDNNSFDWDSSGYLDGTGNGKYPYRSSGSSTSQNGSHDHDTATSTHTHSLSLSFSPSWSLPDDIMLNSDSVDSLEYDVVTNSVGIQLITRMY